MGNENADEAQAKEYHEAPAKGWEPEEIEVARWQYDAERDKEKQEQERT